MSIDKDVVEKIMSDTDIDSDYVQSLVDTLVSSCCDNLDKYVEYVSKILNDSDYALTNEELDDIIMTVPTLLYFIGTQQEKLGIKQDVSESTRTLLYNKIYMETTGTAGYRKAKADTQLFNESLVSIVYERAYDTIKGKVSYALELLQSAKKIMSRRISETDLTKVTPSKNIFQ